MHSLTLVDEVHVVRVTPWRNKARALPALATARPLTHVLLDGPGLIDTVEAAARTPPSVVFAFCSGMARLASLRALEGVPLVHDMVDVDSAKWSTLGAAARWPLSAIYAREARTLRRFEEEVTRRARHTLVVNARERDLLLSIAPGSRVSAVANGVDAASFQPPGSPGDAPAIVFTGVFDYGPNETAALWLMSDVWPRVVAARPDARLALVGANPSSAVRRKAASSAAVTVTGAVPDVQTLSLDRCRRCCADLHVTRDSEQGAGGRCRRPAGCDHHAGARGAPVRGDSGLQRR